MNTNIDAAEAELALIRDRAETLADAIDPRRTWTAKDELTREIVKACDVINSQASHAVRLIKLARERSGLA